MKKKTIYWLIAFGFIAITIFDVFLVSKNYGYKKGQIDALSGKNEYKQVIYYEWIYNSYYPVDTVYIKLK